MTNHDKYGCKILTGAEFEKAAREVTPLSRIKAPFPKNVPAPHGREYQGITGRRHETKDKLR